MRLTLTVALLALSSCNEGPPAVVVEIHSDLEIPQEANSLVARVQVDGRSIAEETYPLGTAPRDRWPQTLPVIAGSIYDDRVLIAAEARIALSGPSVVAGFGELEISFPSSGEEVVRLDLPRSCADGDDDGYGIGFGCKRPDCDDTNPDVPSNALCPGFELPDAGPEDAGPKDAEPDAGPIDAGADAGVTGEPCGATTCAPDEACFGEMCFMRCVNNEDCGALTLGCLDNIGVCICRVPCINGNQDCGPYECIDGCCEL